MNVANIIGWMAEILCGDKDRTGGMAQRTGRWHREREWKVVAEKKAKEVETEVEQQDHSPLNFSPPSPPRMIAFMNAKNRSPYSCGGTGLILCYIHPHQRSAIAFLKRKLNKHTLSALNPFHIPSICFFTVHGVKISITPR